tara:strand:+ start:39 stop:308 length:270 start_codon:yes stop_codon:yes gene_type:complete
MNWYNFWYKISFYYVVGCTAYIFIASMALIVISLVWPNAPVIEALNPEYYGVWYYVIKGIFLELPSMLLPVAVAWFIYYLIHGKIRKPE